MCEFLWSTLVVFWRAAEGRYCGAVSSSDSGPSGGRLPSFRLQPPRNTHFSFAPMLNTLLSYVSNFVFGFSFFPMILYTVNIQYIKIKYTCIYLCLGERLAFHTRSRDFWEVFRNVAEFSRSLEIRVNLGRVPRNLSESENSFDSRTTSLNTRDASLNHFQNLRMSEVLCP